MGQEKGHFGQNHTCSIFQLFIQRLVTKLKNQVGPCSKVFKIISRNLIQKRTEYINIQEEKQNNLTTRFKVTVDLQRPNFTIFFLLCS